MSDWPAIYGFLILVGVAVIGMAVFACRMSYEKYCLRIKKPFKTWL